MIREARGFGADITEAQENARINLGAAIDDDVQFEIITQSKKKVLGLFGGCQAEVRAYIELPDEKPAKQKPAPKKKEVKKEKTPVAQKPSQASQKSQQAAPKQPKKETVAKTEAVFESIDYSKAVDESLIAKDSNTGRAITYLKEILSGLGCENITVKAIENENSAVIVLDGEGLGVVIGRRGETLDALQYLSSLAANNGGGYFIVTVNIGNYREKREQTLIALAEKVAAQVKQNGRSRALEPMNPYERRIIHTAVQGIEGVVSNSIGSGAARKVVIYPEGKEAVAPRNNRNSKGGRNNRSSRGNDRRSNTVATTPTREPKKDSDIPLYGKIN